MEISHTNHSTDRYELNIVKYGDQIYFLLDFKINYDSLKFRKTLMNAEIR